MTNGTDLQDLPGYSVVIPVLNEAPHLAELLPLLMAQDPPPLEVVVADADSSDGGEGLARRLGAKVVPGGRPAPGRNHGAQACHGEWLFFMDADCRPPAANFAGQVLQELARRGLCAAVSDVSAHYRPGDRGYSRPWLRFWDRRLLGIQNTGQRVMLGLGFPVGTAQFMAVRQDAFRQLGGFRTEVEPFEDSELLLRLHRGITAPTGLRSCVGILPPDLRVLVSMRRFDAKGRFFFPFRMSFRSTLLRWLLKRELPLPTYWDLNQTGFTTKGQRPQADGRP